MQRTQQAKAAEAMARAEAAAAAGKSARAAGILLRHVVHAPGDYPDLQVRGFLLLARLARSAGRTADARGYAILARLRAEQACRADLMAAALEGWPGGTETDQADSAAGA